MEDLKQKYELYIRAIRKETNQLFNQIMTMIQHNPKLTQIKPEALLNENFGQ
jgi:phage terminase large subunit-like protein